MPESRLEAAEGGLARLARSSASLRDDMDTPAEAIVGADGHMDSPLFFRVGGESAAFLKAMPDHS